MNTINIDDLLTQGYTEDHVAKRRFERRWFIASAPPLLCFTIIGGLAILGRLSLQIAVPCAVAAFLVLMIVLAAAEHASAVSRHSGKDMVKYRNARPPRGIIRETVYVCPDSRTFFRRTWFVEGDT
jgi:hypothetical protein